MKVTKIAVLSAAAVLMAGAIAPARAALVDRDYTINAAGNCNGALPSFEGALRKRPTAIANEGTSTAFVSCSLPGDFNNTTGNSFFGVGFNNSTASAVTVSCTFVDGFAAPFSAEGPKFYVQEVSIPANGPGVAIWDPADEGVDAFSQNANVSCGLPPGVEINLLEVSFQEDNGVVPPG